MPSHVDFMRQAVELAVMGVGHTRPNPPVGAVIVKGSRVIGRGYHQRAGMDHAEVEAINSAKTSVKGATMYVTLEPCSIPGRVGACTDAIIAAGIGKVVYACKDPNPKNAGRAKRVLAKAGIECDALKKNPENEVVIGMAEMLIEPFRKRVQTGLPYVTVKLAMSLDGKIVDDFGDAKWISSDRARLATGKLRERVDAIMVGAETIRRDNPSLLSHGKQNDDLLRVVISASGKLPRKAQVFTDGKNDTLVFPDAELALRELAKRGVMHVLCEGGLKLATSLAEDGLVDDWISVISPVVIGSRHLREAERGMTTFAAPVGTDAFCKFRFDDK